MKNQFSLCFSVSVGTTPLFLFLTDLAKCLRLRLNISVHLRNLRDIVTSFLNFLLLIVIINILPHCSKSFSDIFFFRVSSGIIKNSSLYFFWQKIILNKIS